MIINKMMNTVRDSLFMAYVLTVDGVTTHFDKADLILVYQELFDADLVVDYVHFCCSKEDHDLKKD